MANFLSSMFELDHVDVTGGKAEKNVISVGEK